MKVLLIILVSAAVKTEQILNLKSANKDFQTNFLDAFCKSGTKKLEKEQDFVLEFSCEIDANTKKSVTISLKPTQRFVGGEEKFPFHFSVSLVLTHITSLEDAELLVLYQYLFPSLVWLKDTTSDLSSFAALHPITTDDIAQFKPYIGNPELDKMEAHRYFVTSSKDYEVFVARDKAKLNFFPSASYLIWPKQLFDVNYAFFFAPATFYQYKDTSNSQIITTSKKLDAIFTNSATQGIKWGAKGSAKPAEFVFELKDDSVVIEFINFQKTELDHYYAKRETKDLLCQKDNQLALKKEGCNSVNVAINENSEVFTVTLTAGDRLIRV